jgi:nucleoside-diphosphate-sugar epimerase
MLPALPTRDLDDILDRTRDLWTGVRGGRLFITGGTGFFGAWLLESFVWANSRLGLDARATVLSRNPEAFLQKLPHLGREAALSFQRGDTAHFEFPSGNFTHVVHAATEIYGPDADRTALFERDVQATRRTLDFARGAQACRYLFTSSGAVYGRQPSELTHVPEDFTGAPEPSDPNAGYGHAKRVSEFLCSRYAMQHGLQTTIARCFAFVGPHLPLDGAFAIGNFIRDAMAGGPLRIAGDGTPYRSYLYASDLATWLWTILFAGNVARPYNVGSDADLSISALANEVASTLAKGASIVRAREPDPSVPPLRYVPDNRRAREELGLSVTVPLPEAIRRTAEWYRQT